jgi:leucyl aminopeptidase (aminopeptidase T)
MSAPGFVKSVVKTCLRIRKEDRVSIFAWRHMLDLAEALALECKRTGAKTHIEVVTDELYYQTVLDLPLDYLKETDLSFDLALLDVATANIFIQGPENPEKMKQITPERWRALIEYDKPYYDKFRERKIRSAQITLGYVTRQRAKTYGFNYDEWKENIDAAMDVKYEEMRDLGKKIAGMLEKATEVHITTAKGTNLTLALEGRVAHVYDGVIDDDDIREGAVFASLPAGCVAVAPKERSARGTYASNVPEAITGLLVRDVAWVFKNGRLESFNGGKNIDGVKAKWEKARGDKDQIGSLMIGLNPKARKGFLDNSIVLGTVTLSVGDNRDIGGKMESDFEFHCTVTEPTVELDGKTVIKHGRFTV